MSHTVILGNGIAGVTFARHLRKADAAERITLVSGETPYFFSRTALMYEYMGHMPWKMLEPYQADFWPKNRLELHQAWVEHIDFSSKQLLFQTGGTLAYDRLVLAVGSTPNTFGWPGETLPGVQGLYSKQDLDLLYENTLEADRTTRKIENAVVVGGGLIGIELAEMLLTRGIKVTMLVREPAYWSNVLPREEATMVGRHMTTDHHVDLRLGVNLDRIEPGPDGRVSSVVVKETNERLACQLVGLTAGVRPNVDFLKEADIELDKGILVDTYFQTSQPDVYAVGDCAQFRQPPSGRKAVEQVWYTGRMHGETLAHNLTSGSPVPYRPGPWFNSAKFFDIEYQTYGWVSPQPEDHEQHLYWEHESGKRAIRVVWHKDEGHLLAINLMGVRFRHEVCDRWLQEKAPIDHVVRNLVQAFFDAEFSQSYHREVVHAYHALSPEKKVDLPTKKKKLFGLFS